MWYGLRMSSSSPLDPIGPFRGRIQLREDMGGAHLTLPADLRPLRVAMWLFLALCAILPIFLSGPLGVLALIGMLPVGLLLDRILVGVAHAFVRGSWRARLGLLGGLLVWLGGTAVAIGGGIMLWLAMLFWLVVFYVGFALLAGRAPTLQLDERALTMTRHTRLPTLRQTGAVQSAGRVQKRVIALEQIAAIRRKVPRLRSLQAEGVVLELVSGEQVTLWSGSLRIKERHWLVMRIQERVDHRRGQLDAAGHDLTAPAPVPAALQTLREPG